MDRVLKRFLQLYPITRNWTIISNYIAPLQSVQRISRAYSVNSTDYMQLENSIPSIEKNHAFSYIGIAQKSIKILEEAAVNYKYMTLNVAIHTLVTLFNNSKNLDDVSIQSIKNHAGFIYLCEVLNRNIRLLKTHEILQILKLFTYFKMPTNNLLTQSLLQMIRTNINEISLHDITFLVFLLNKMESTPLRDALLIALPLVFEVQLLTKLDPNNILQLKSSLKFIIEHNISNLDTILELLKKYENNVDARTALSIFYSLCEASYLPPIAFEVLSNMQRILINNAKILTIRNILQVLKKHRFLKNKEYRKFYNEALMDALVNSALSSNIDFDSGIYLLKMLNELNYAHIPLLEYLAAKCFEQPNLLKDTTFPKMFAFLEGLINVDYKPVFWDTIRDAILTNGEKNQLYFGQRIIRYALYLIALDCYNPSLLSEVFTQKIGNDKIYMNKKAKTDCAKELLLLHQSVKTLYPMYTGPSLSQDIFEYASSLKLESSKKFSLKAALELALGGPQYLYNDLRTKLGHYIDHVVVMRKGGYPVAINTSTLDTTNRVYIEDIQTPSESQMILIFNLPDFAYTVNSQRLKSTWSLQIKTAEALTKSNIIVVNCNSLMKLSEHERVPYLMQAIKLKCEDLQVN